MKESNLKYRVITKNRGDDDAHNTLSFIETHGARIAVESLLRFIGFRDDKEVHWTTACPFGDWPHSEMVLFRDRSINLAWNDEKSSILVTEVREQG